MLEFISNEALAHLATFRDHLRFPLTQVGSRAPYLLPASVHLPVLPPAAPAPAPAAATTRMQWIVTAPPKPRRKSKQAKRPVDLPERFAFPRTTRLDLLETLVQLTAAVAQAGWSIPAAFARPQALELTLAAGTGLVDLTLHHSAGAPLYAEVTRAHDAEAAARAQAMLLDLCSIAR
ncbi:hypothetical protein [Hymenobacter ruricola]|uniref:Uncharacterized protein n=1 Tax=Hymenobacter ruricola TaxID=2791023 RepID=A0ABS0I354_9BACT|nr:hypothetical protein [Hymenobacter ruricola]MBF9221370.1 hypothetical protein [Hymenobacter ruricola]